MVTVMQNRPDRWERWKIHTSHGPIYVLMSRELPSDWPDEAFTTIWPPPAQVKEEQLENGSQQQ
jgi:hypothetical protein